MEFLMKKLNPLKNFRFDAVLIDNPIFKLHHQGNFFLVLFGVVFTYGINYLDKNAIICDDKVRALVSKLMILISIMICRICQNLLISIVGFMAVATFRQTFMGRI